MPMLTLALPRNTELSRFQPLQRDISVTVADPVPVQDMLDAINALSHSDGRLSALREFRLFDVYRAPPNSSKVAEASANVLLNKEKSLAFRAVLQDTGRALTDAEADAAVKAIVEVLEQKFGARLRS